VCYLTEFSVPRRLIAFVKGRKLIEFNVGGRQLVHPFHVCTFKWVCKPPLKIKKRESL